MPGGIEKIEKILDGTGRVLLRASGTEPVVRVMVEGEESRLVERLAIELSETVGQLLEA